MNLQTPSRFRLWLLVAAVCAAVVLISTRISGQMTLWGIVASVFLLLWLWSRLSRPNSPQ
jgi:membrane protein implicated in regulation of membrane protease activity